MSSFRIIVIGASAGGVEALSTLARLLSPEINAAIFITVHIPAHSKSVLPEIIRRAGKLPAKHPEDGEAIVPGQIYIAPPDNHIIIRKGIIRLSHGPRENSHRPSVDPMFRSAAVTYGNRVIGVVITGTLDDGTAGLVAVKQRGGTSVVQDPEEAIYAGMPRSAVENAPVDHILPLAEIPALLERLSSEKVTVNGREVPEGMEIENDLSSMDPHRMHDDHRNGTPSGFGCPECGGALWEMEEGDLVRFRCRVGHAYSSDSLMAEKSDSLEAALWTALRALEESASLS